MSKTGVDKPEGPAGVGPGYVRMMAAYNAEMNRRLYAATARLPDVERRRHRGAFWGSIQGTLAHLVWGDRQWMARFDGWTPNPVGLASSAVETLGFEALQAERTAMDAGIEDWAARVEPAWLAGSLTWFSGAAQCELHRPIDLLVMQFFNHQTHHRGQVHAMLTAAGEQTGDTDLMLVI